MKCTRASGGTFMKALSVALSTSLTAVIRFPALSATILVDTSFALGSVKSRNHKQGTKSTCIKLHIIKYIYGYLYTHNIICG